MFALPRFALLLLLLLAGYSVDAYQTKVNQNLIAQDRSNIPVHYRFEWEIYDTTAYEASGADKAELQDRARDVLKTVLREHAAKLSGTALSNLANGGDAERALVIAVETNEQVAGLGIRLIDSEFLPTDE